MNTIIFSQPPAGNMPIVAEAQIRITVYMSATISSRAHSGCRGHSREVRRNPLAILPFSATASPFWHRFNIATRYAPSLVHISHATRSQGARFLWPGSGENGQLLTSIVEPDKELTT